MQRSGVSFHRKMDVKKVGNEMKVRIGIDTWIGIIGDHNVSDDLVGTLRQKNIST